MSAARATPHYVASYEGLVAQLRATKPHDEAMSLAVGGHFDAIGHVERNIVRCAGLTDGMSLVDVGCGSGRLAAKLGDLAIDYVGTDVVQDLLDYAATRSSSHFRFVRHTAISVPMPDGSVDMVCFFSVLTHLTHVESFLYLEDACRALRPGGRIVFSFLEFAEPRHWQVFRDTVEAERAGATVHLNSFIDRPMIMASARSLGLRVVEIASADEACWGDGHSLGQAVAILEKAGPPDHAGLSS